mmetsp:Transcript_126516/g.369668  ORF Transcript_126516/g.369668 Transcript_126516/m.369668 type:complete len:642 (-) Transcript_126516:94-2019(-)
MEPGTLRLAKDGLCALCYAKATMLCSKCKQRWYCSSGCQAKDWHLGHKGDCGLADLPVIASVPFPPARLLPDSVERPVLGEAAWRRLIEGTELGPHPGPARGLRNLGNTCYMNAVLQGLYHAAPPLLAACQEHRSGRSNGRCPPCSPGSCFRCDLEAVSSGCMEPRPRVPAVASVGPSPAEELHPGDRVVLQGLDRGELNGQEGIIVAMPDGAASDEARCSVQLLGQGGKKAVRPQNLELRCRAPVGPAEVSRWLPRLGAEFTFGMQEDAHEFLRSLLRLIEDEELKEHAESLRKRGTEDSVTPAANADLTASPSRIFGGLLASQCTCTNRQCGVSSFSFERFMDLSLDITEATDSVEDALRLFTAPERLDKKNGWKCETCNETVRARKQITIYAAPSFLALQLKRFRYGERGKVTRPVAFSAELNLRPFLCSGVTDAGKPLLYELRAVVVHLDKAGYSHFGHYVAYVRCAPPPGVTGPSRWYLLDDSQVAEVPEAEVLRQQAYLLFYAAAEAVPVVRKGGVDASPTQSAPLPSKCRGRNGDVCTFFACSDGLCTRCYQEEHGRPPPAPAADSKPRAAEADVAAPKKAAASGKSGAGAAGRPASGKAPPPAASGKAKKVGANDQCPCGSGKKYKKCHGAAS